MEKIMYHDGKSDFSDVPNIRCELVSGEDVSHLEGELKTFIETFGFDPKREKAIKDVLQTILWDWFNFITDHILDHLEEKKEWYKNKGLELPDHSVQSGK